MIDLSNGMIDFNGVKIGPQMCYEDFLQYGSDIVDIDILRDGMYIIYLNNMINSNGIDAEIVFHINENVNIKEVIITPRFKKTDGMDRLTASRKWFKGFSIGDYIDDNSGIRGHYDWGSFIAQYVEDRDYGKAGGEIEIYYGE